MASRSNSHFVTGFLFGALFGGLLMLAVVFMGPIATRDEVIERTNQRLFETTVRLDTLRKQTQQPPIR